MASFFLWRLFVQRAKLGPVTLLPVVERELRTAARKRGTFRLRAGAALIALLIGGSIMLMHQFGAIPVAEAGKALFQTLIWVSFVIVLFAGLFFTSDCLSEEKRDGTLGLLFLTDLRGYDVVFGKLMATSLRAFYGLLAIFPILAICLLLGGVSGADFWKSLLAVINALLCSLAVGLFVSSVSRDSQRAFSATFLILILLLGGGPLIDFLLDQYFLDRFVPIGTLLSPAYLFLMARDWGTNPFWLSLLINQIAVLCFFALTAFLLPRTWQDKPQKRGMIGRSWAYAWKYGGRRRRARLRHKFLDLNPALWLALQERWQSLGLWILVGIGFAVILLQVLGTTQPGAFPVWQIFYGILIVFVYLMAGSQAGRFFVEARRTGVLELLLETPLTPREIVLGQWQALLRMFTAPVLLLLLLNVASIVIWRFFLSTPTSTSRPTLLADWMTWASQFGSMITHVMDLIALAWFGMWMGVTSKNGQQAALKSILFVLVIPWIVYTFAWSMTMAFLTFGTGFLGGSSNPWFFPMLQLVMATFLALAKDLAFIFWARKKLYGALRLQAVEGGAVRPGLKWLRLPRRNAQPSPEAATRQA